MFCKNCGVEMNEGAAACMSCGFAKGAGESSAEIAVLKSIPVQQSA